jgi:hypothetical protein
MRANSFSSACTSQKWRPPFWRLTLTRGVSNNQLKLRRVGLVNRLQSLLKIDYLNKVSVFPPDRNYIDIPNHVTHPYSVSCNLP